jgi:hypothetical protein
MGPGQGVAFADTSTVPQGLLDTLRLMDIRLNELIRDVESGHISTYDLREDIYLLVQMKYDAISNYFPRIFGHRPEPLISLLDGVDEFLRLAGMEARGAGFNKKLVIKWLIRAKRSKRALEDILEMGPAAYLQTSSRV